MQVRAKKSRKHLTLRVLTLRMFQSLAETVLIQILSPYFQDISRQNIHVGVYSGRLILNNIKFKPDILSSLGFFVKSGHVESLEVRFPWSDILSAKVAIVITGATLDVVRTFGEAVYLSRREMIDRAKLAMEKRLADVLASTQLTMLAKLSRRIISNLSISITNVKASLTVDETIVSFELASVAVDSLIEADAAIFTGIVDKKLEISGFRATMGSSEIIKPFELTLRARFHSNDKSLLILLHSQQPSGIQLDKAELEALMLLIDILNKADALIVQLNPEEADVPSLSDEATMRNMYESLYSSRSEALVNLSRQVSVSTAARWEYEFDARKSKQVKESVNLRMGAEELIEQPVDFSVTLDLANLTLVLSENGVEVIRGILRGFHLDCEIRGNQTSLEISTLSMHTSYMQEQILFFEPKTAGGVAQFCTVVMEGSAMSVDYRACPLVLDYREGLLPAVYRFLDVLAPASSAVLEKFAAYRPQLEATRMNLLLDLDAPLIKLPISENRKALVSLGQFELSMSPDLALMATLSNVSLQSVDGHGRTVTILAKTGFSLGGTLGIAMSLDIEIDDSVCINLDYPSLDLIQQGIALVMQELYSNAKASMVLTEETESVAGFEMVLGVKFKGAEIRWTDSLLLRSRVEKFQMLTFTNGAVTYKVDNLLFCLSTLHPTCGVWEPLLETSGWDMTCSMPTLKSVDFSLTALTPVNFNVSPTNLKTLLKALAYSGASMVPQVTVVNAQGEVFIVGDEDVIGGAHLVTSALSDSIKINDSLVSMHGECAVVKDGLIGRAVNETTVLISSKLVVANLCQVPLRLSTCTTASVSVSWLGLPDRVASNSWIELDDDILLPNRCVSVGDSFKVQFHGKSTDWSEEIRSCFKDEVLVIGDVAIKVEVERSKDGLFVLMKLLPCLTLSNEWPVDLFVRFGSETAGLLKIPAFSEVDVFSVESLNEVKEKGFLIGLSAFLMTVGIDHLTNRTFAEARLNLAIEDMSTRFPMTLQYSVYRVIFKTERLLIDMTDEKLVFFCGGMRLPLGKVSSACPIWLLPSLDSEEKLECMEPGYTQMHVQLPASFWSFEKLVSGLHVTFKVEDRDGCSVVLVTPRYRAVNALSYPLTLRSGKTLEPGCSKVLKRGSLDVKDWREVVPLEQNGVGTWSLFSKAGKVVTLDIVPNEGVTTVSILPDPLYVIHNKTSHQVRFCMEGERKWLTVKSRESTPLGWKYPFTALTPSVTVDFGDEAIKVDLSLVYQGQSRYVKLATGLSHPRSIDLIVLDRTRKCEIDQFSFKIALAIPAISVSLCTGLSEVLYTELSFIRAFYVGDTRGSQKLELVIAKLQVESGIHGRETHPAILRNKGKDGTSFLRLSLDGVAAQATDAAVLKLANIEADTLIIDIDDAVLESCARFATDLFPNQVNTGPSLTSWLSSILPVSEQHLDPIPLPPLLAIAKLAASDIKLKLWVSLSIANLMNVSPVVKVLLRVVTISGKFKIHGAKLSLKHREFQPYRGPIQEYFTFLQSEYGVALFTALVGLLSKSSLLNIPLYPIKVLSKTGSIGIGSIGAAVNDVGSAIDKFVFDEDYAASQERMRKKKDITTIAGGFHEGAKRAIEGVEGLFDIFRQPIVGARDHGVEGFIKGLGRGIVGSVVKPVTKVGEAIGDITTGMSKLAASADVSKGRPVTARCRLPRALYSGRGLIQEYSKVDAVLLNLVGEQFFSDAEAVVVVPVKGNAVNVIGLLLLHSDHVRYLEIDLQKEVMTNSWKMQGNDMKRVNIIEGNVLVLTGTLNASERCKLPQQEALAKGIVSELLAHKGGSQFDWRSWLNLRASLPFSL